ncbi:proton-conducting transporter membrane subunit [Telmatospirillum sp. J64-1]|uniref:proton-conducting transporter transmembrane domain-containing protein n=1 Tax=Telmatospirillum sp. J64-1 TaxID=2502183 RepID=UPI00115CDB83|nr:proton-conducting transporter membrane subunit [Telmatospirillum sp. J64-1]
MTMLLSLALLTPLALFLLAMTRKRGWAARLAPVAPLPALAAAFLVPVGSEMVLPDLLLGLRLGIDGPAPVFLAFTALIWAGAAWAMRADPQLLEGRAGARFLLAFLATMTGNLGVVLALDGPGFYLFFTVMTFGGYGLIARQDGPEAAWAAKLYLGLALVGEMVMLAGFLLAESGAAALAIGLAFYFGMGVKHGVLPLHAWLPPAHGIAPVPASALLSGAMLKAGLLGWMRFLPLAEDALPDLSGLMVAGGLAAAFLAALAGIMQKKAKMVLGYSSISQMGILTVGFGLASADPSRWSLVLPALVLMALHHALVKAALFLGVGSSRDGTLGRLAFPLLVLLSLAIAGFPLTGGALAKLWLDEVGGGYEIDMAWTGALGLLLPFTATASTLLMARFLWLVRPGTPPAVAAPVTPAPFLLLAVAGLVGPWFLLLAQHDAPLLLALAPDHLWKTLWPVLLGLVPVVAALRSGRGMPSPVPPGDVAVWLAGPLSRLPRFLPGGEGKDVAPPMPVHLALPSLASRIEREWRRFPLIGVAYLLLLLALALMAGFPA